MESSRSATCFRSLRRPTTGTRDGRGIRRAAPLAASSLERRRLRAVIATTSFGVLRQPLESAQYLSIRYTERLAEAGIEPSVGSRGDSYDNALAESVIGLFKTEVIRRRGPWRSLEDVEFATLEWVWWFNYHRLLEPIGYVPPVEYEEAYYRRQEGQAEVATLNSGSLR